MDLKGAVWDSLDCALCRARAFFVTKPMSAVDSEKCNAWPTSCTMAVQLLGSFSDRGILYPPE